MQGQNIPATLWNQVQTTGDKRIALRKYNGDEVTEFNWSEYGDRVARTALGLNELGLDKEERVAIIGSNRPEWLEADLGTICAGGISVPIYVTLPSKQIHYILEHSESKFCVVENRELLETVMSLKGDLPQLEKVIVMECADIPGGESQEEKNTEEVISQERVRRLGEGKDKIILDRVAEETSSEEVFTIVYTSGTTGFPKGVMLTHKNMLSAIQTLTETVGIYQEDHEYNLSFLPLAHIAERMLSCFISAYLGATVSFGKGLDTLAEDLRKTRPTVFFAVPRLYEKFYEAINKRIDEMQGVKAKLARWAISKGFQRMGYVQNGKKVPKGLERRYRLGQKLVFNKLKDSIGLDRIKVIASGAAPISREILEFFHAIDLPVREIYGQTEDCAVTSIHPNENIKLGTVGKPFPGLQIKFDEDGEILIKGEQVFIGYFKDKKSTEESFSDGWFHTGDVGMLDEEGFLIVTDRKKDLIITAGGKNIAPQPIENTLKMQSYISNVVLVGDRRPYLIALITLDEETLVPWAEEKGLKFENFSELTQLPEVKELVREAVEETNSQLAGFETIKRWKILPHDFSVDSGELTPTLKIKRHVIGKSYQQLIEDLYGSQTTA